MPQIDVNYIVVCFVVMSIVLAVLLPAHYDIAKCFLGMVTTVALTTLAAQHGLSVERQRVCCAASYAVFGVFFLLFCGRLAARARALGRYRAARRPQDKSF